MPPRRIALLRGINVGKAKRIAMADLRETFERLGYHDVRTLLNSGNVVFSGSVKGARAETAVIEKAITDRLKVAAGVAILSAQELERALRGNPLASTSNDPARLLVLVLRDARAAGLLKPLLAESWAPEAIVLRGRIGYLWCPNGIARSCLWAAVNRAIGDAGTARNLTTMTKLLGMAGEA